VRISKQEEKEVMEQAREMVAKLTKQSKIDFIFSENDLFLQWNKQSTNSKQFIRRWLFYQNLKRKPISYYP
jgi:hypothetical protein